jgi:hypothetical protein
MDGAEWEFELGLVRDWRTASNNRIGRATGVAVSLPRRIVLRD